MGETGILWLRVAAALYFVGLVDAIVAILGARGAFFRAASYAVGCGALFHFVSLVEQGMADGRFPVTSAFETLSFCGWIVAAAFTAVFIRYKNEAASLSIFIFPLAFLMTLIAALRSPVAGWSNPAVRSAWLTVHILAELLGYAALAFASAASMLYLIQERRLKRKTPPPSRAVMPSLWTLDDFISRSLAIGFVFVTIGVIVGSVWAFIEHGVRWLANDSITLSLVTWGIYLALIFMRVSAGWRGRKAALLSLAALICCAATWAAHIGLQARLQ